MRNHSDATSESARVNRLQAGRSTQTIKPATMDVLPATGHMIDNMANSQRSIGDRS
jgi:hypothetical protein